MRQRNNIAEASAEMLLNYLYPEVERKWIAHGEGSFYRNYTNDLLDFDDETMDAWLARDTFLRLLPQGVINNDNDLKGEDAAEKFKKLRVDADYNHKEGSLMEQGDDADTDWQDEMYGTGIVDISFYSCIWVLMDLMKSLTFFITSSSSDNIPCADLDAKYIFKPTIMLSVRKIVIGQS